MSRTTARSTGCAFAPTPRLTSPRALAAASWTVARRGLTVAKVSEAEVMLGAEPQDLLIAYPIIGQAKLKRLTEIARRTRVTVSIDSSYAAHQISEAAQAGDVEIGILAETDVGMGRVGVNPGDALLQLAQTIVSLPHLRWEGITFYPGQIKDLEESGQRALAEVAGTLGEILGRFRTAGMEPKIVSGGSTPTLFRSHELGGLNEIRPGTYVFNDINTIRSGACAMEDCAAAVHATIISTARPGQIVIDGGSKTFSSDRLANPAETTFGHVVDSPSARFHKMNEEHGMIDITQTDGTFEVGGRLRIIPKPRLRVAVNLHERVYGVRDGMVEEVWNVEGRGKLQ